MKNQILAAEQSPHSLESLYRKNPPAFEAALRDALTENPSSLPLQIWKERLFFSSEPATEKTASPSLHRAILWTFFLSLLAGSLVKLPSWLFPNEIAWPLIAKNTCAILAGALTLYLFSKKNTGEPLKKRLSPFLFPAFLFFLIVTLSNLYPPFRASEFDCPSSTAALTCIHTPFLFLSIFGIAFLGKNWRSPSEKNSFLRYCGDLLICSSLLLLGGIVLTGITLALFEAIGFSIYDWYISNVVVYGIVASPVVAAFLLDKTRARDLSLSPVLAKIFTPLFLATIIAYTAAMPAMQKTPFSDRRTLVILNLLLVIVLALNLFCMMNDSPSPRPAAMDFLRVALVFLTLLIDALALSAIVSRSFSEGMTPNRAAVLGTNLLFFFHLSTILYHSIRFVANRGTREQISFWGTAFLPAYTAWCAIVAFLFPPLFNFR